MFCVLQTPKHNSMSPAKGRISHCEGMAEANYRAYWILQTLSSSCGSLLVASFPLGLFSQGPLISQFSGPGRNWLSCPAPARGFGVPGLHSVLGLLARDQVGQPFHQKGSEQTKTAKDQSLQLPLSQLLTDTRSLLSESLVSKLCFPVLPKFWVKRHPRLLHLCSTLTDLWVFSPLGLNNWGCFMKSYVWKAEF